MADPRPYLARDATSTPDAAVCRWCSTVKVRARHGSGGLGTDTPPPDDAPAGALMCCGGCDGQLVSRG